MPPTRRRRSAPRTSFTCRSACRCASSSSRRRDPQLLGAEPRRQAGPDPGPRERHHRRSEQVRASTAASAPNSAACSTPTWRSTSSSSPIADFLKWWAPAARSPRRRRATPLAMAGYDYVTSGPCAPCHNIGGTPASGQVAPDLTHLASRRRLAAGTLPMNTRQSRRLGRRSAVAQARHTRCRRSASSPTSCTPSSPIWRRSNDRRRATLRRCRARA